MIALRIVAVLVIATLGGCVIIGKRGSGPERSLVNVGEEAYPLWRLVGTDSILVDGVVYRVESRFAADSVLWIQSRLVAANRTEGVTTASYGACLPLVRLYLDSARAGLPIWDESLAISEKEGCTGRRGRPYRLEPGQERQLHVVAVAPRRLRAYLPPRLYYFSVVFWLGGQAYEVASGQAELES